MRTYPSNAICRLLIVCALAVSGAPHANADWDDVGTESSSGDSTGVTTTSRDWALEELARIRARLSTLKEEISGGQSVAAPSVDDIRGETLANEIAAIMAQPDADASERLQDVSDMTRQAIDDLNAIENAGGGSENSDWSEDYE